jgi:hypothetical protein
LKKPKIAGFIPNKPRKTKRRRKLLPIYKTRSRRSRIEKKIALRILETTAITKPKLPNRSPTRKAEIHPHDESHKIIDVEGDDSDEATPSIVTSDSSLIITPRFQKIGLPRYFGRLGIKSPEDLEDDVYLKRHRPMEIAERRAKKREAEVARYSEYIMRLRQNSPELWCRKMN